MFGISFSEIVLILVIALLILGPKQLPQIASKIGLLIFSIKKYFNSLKNELYQQTGISEIYATKHELINTYSAIKQNISFPQRIETEEYDSFWETEPQLYQPELDFDRQPELFDHV